MDNENKILFKDGIVYDSHHRNFRTTCILVENGIIKNINPVINYDGDTKVIDCTGKYILPGFTDMHVHFREPGFEYKETIKTGSMAGMNGGYSHVCTMPNLNPVPDSLENLKIQLEAIKKDAAINVHPFGSITKGEKGEVVSNMEELAPYVIGFSDDGVGVKDYDVMYEAMYRAEKLNKPIAGHCEVKEITGSGIINDGTYAKMNNLNGIPSESEWKEVERNIEIAEKTGCHFHVCHASTKETLELVKKAKKNKIFVTCETAPHYLLLSELDMKDDGRYRFQPPLRSLNDRIALLEALKDGTIDMIATDHAPHSLEEKSKGIAGSANGIVGLECAFPMLYTYLVKQNIVTLPKLLDLMVYKPQYNFGIGSDISVGSKAEFSVWDLDTKTKINSNEFESKGRFTPFDGKDVYGIRKLSLVRGQMYEGKR